VTTIIADAKRGIMVADSRVTTYSSLANYSSDKLYRHGKSIFGEQGDVETGLRFRRWILDGQPKKGRPVFGDGTDDKFTALELAPDGLWLWDFTLNRQRLLDEVFSTGSGSMIALYCVRVLGKTLEEAIIEAAKIDIHTAEPVQVMRLDEAK